MKVEIQNFSKVENKLSGLGFREPEFHQSVLKEAAKTKVGEFTKSTSKEFDTKKVDYNFTFNMKDNNVYLNKIAIKNGNTVFETKPNFTSKEMFNLTEGRSVKKDFNTKDGEKNTAFVKLETDQKGKQSLQFFNENYGYSVENALKKYPQIKIPEQYMERTIKSLEKGNSQIVKTNKDETLFVAYNPQFKALTVHNEKGQKMFQKFEGDKITIGHALKEKVQTKIASQQTKSYNSKIESNVNPDANPLTSKTESNVTSALLDDLENGALSAKNKRSSQSTKTNASEGNAQKKEAKTTTKEQPVKKKARKIKM